MLCSIVNTIIMFTTFKSVVLFHQPTKPLYEGDSTWLIKSRNASLVRLDVNTDMPEDSDGWIKRSPSPILECRWMLRQWAPSIFSTTIFSWFSPPQVAILYGVDAQNWSYMIPVAYLTAVVVNLTISAYQDLLNDSKILSGQVLQEFTDSLQFNQPVYPASPLPRTKSKFSP